MLEFEDLTYQIRACVYEVYRCLGHGFLEKVYENALLLELKSKGIRAISQVPLTVHYKGELVGEYVADLVIEDRVLLELKAQKQLSAGNEAQLLNYLRAGQWRVGMLINFAYPRAKIKRLIV
ncbi:MAG: GxxExxY protein [Xanthomonadaceae bacterium]|nr:GxxExxY protein [Xanthomonadaceae bacterium]